MNWFFELWHVKCNRLYAAPNTVPTGCPPPIPVSPRHWYQHGYYIEWSVHMLLSLQWRIRWCIWLGRWSIGFRKLGFTLNCLGDLQTVFSLRRSAMLTHAMALQRCKNGHSNFRNLRNATGTSRVFPSGIQYALSGACMSDMMAGISISCLLIVEKLDLRFYFRLNVIAFD